MRRLAAYAAIFAVPTAIAGIYGMNFDFMPELRWRLGYPLCSRSSSDCVCVYIRFKKSQVAVAAYALGSSSADELERLVAKPLLELTDGPIVGHAPGFASRFDFDVLVIPRGRRGPREHVPSSPGPWVPRQSRTCGSRCLLRAPFCSRLCFGRSRALRLWLSHLRDSARTKHVIPSPIFGHPPYRDPVDRIRERVTRDFGDFFGKLSLDECAKRAGRDGTILAFKRGCRVFEMRLYMWNWLNCYLSGRHDFGVTCSSGSIFLRCIHCGKRSNGWAVHDQQPILVPAAAAGDARARRCRSPRKPPQRSA